jgi:hypothetical protein
MTRSALATAAILAAAATPATAFAATQTATVLAGNGRSVQVVLPGGAVKTLQLAGNGRGVRPGAELRYTEHGSRATGVKVVGHTRTISFDGLVAAAGRHAVKVTLTDGHSLTLPASAAVARSAKAGEAVVANMTLNPSGHVVGLSLSTPGAGTGSGRSKRGKGKGAATSSGAGAGAGAGTGASPTGPEPAANVTTDQRVSGTVASSSLDSNQFNITDGSGHSETFTLNDTLAATDSLLPNACDIVTVSYHADSSGNLIADDVQTTGNDTSGGCAGANDDLVATGPVTAIDLLGGSITITAADGTQVQVGADASLLAGIVLGDAVTVSYYTDSNGNLVADDVEAA